MSRLVISAPFGNYVQPRGALATLGTFTALRRPGRIAAILRTLRYYPGIKAWKNRIGLRNPGIDWLREKTAAGKIQAADKLLSVHGFQTDDWWRLLAAAEELRPMGLELNLSCPNVGEVDWPADLFTRAVATGVPVIAKLPPVNYEQMFQQALDGGVRHFHCCNTLPVSSGGVSGDPLRPVALSVLRRLRQMVGDPAFEELRLVGGGGIRSPEHVDLYADCGVHAVAVATKVFDPRCGIAGTFWRGLGPLAAILQRANERLEQRPAFLEPPLQSSS